MMMPCLNLFLAYGPFLRIWFDPAARQGIRVKAFTCPQLSEIIAHQIEAEPTNVRHSVWIATNNYQKCQG